MATTTGTKVTALTIDTSHSLAEFSVRHMMVSTVKGRFSDISGTIQLDEEEFGNSSVAVDIAAASISTGDEKRDEHLQSADFFDVATYPTIAFRSTEVQPKGNGAFALIGDLTMHGVTKRVTIDAETNGRGVNPWGAEVVAFSGETRINRKDFNLTWNVGLEAGGVLVGDEIRISLEVQASPAQG